MSPELWDQIHECEEQEKFNYDFDGEDTATLEDHRVAQKEDMMKRAPDILSEYEHIHAFGVYTDYDEKIGDMHKILNDKEEEVPENRRAAAFAAIADVEKRLDWLDENQGRLMMDQSNQPAFVITEHSDREKMKTGMYRDATNKEVYDYRETWRMQNTSGENRGVEEQIERDLTQSVLKKRYPHGSWE